MVVMIIVLYYEFGMFLPDILEYENFDLKSIVTPVKVDVYGKLLKEADYDPSKTEFLVKGFTQEFSLCYQGCTKVKRKAPNVKLTVFILNRAVE